LACWTAVLRYAAPSCDIALERGRLSRSTDRPLLPIHHSACCCRHPHTHTSSLSLTNTHTHILSLSLTHTHTHTHSLSLQNTHPPTHTTGEWPSSHCIVVLLWNKNKNRRNYY